MDVRHLPILLVVMMVLMAGCSRQPEHDSRLLQGEILVREYPDSALMLLGTVDSAHLGDADMALYALIKTEALRRTGLTCPDDSLLRSAIDYFSTHNDPSRTSRAYCVLGELGRFCPSASLAQLSEAMLAFYKAKDIAEANGLQAEAARAWGGMAGLALNRFLNSQEASKYARQELHYARLCGNNWRIRDALITDGQALMNLGKLDEAERRCEEFMETIKSPEDEEWYVAGLRVKAFIASARGNNTSAYELFTKVSNSRWAFTTDTLHRGVTLMWSGDMEGGRIIMESVQKNPNVPVWRDRLLADYYAEKRNYMKAFVMLRESYNANEEELGQILNNNTLTQLSAHYELTQQLDRAEVERARWQMWLIIVVAAVVVAGVIALAVWRHRRQQRIIAEKIRIADDLQETLGQSREELERIRSDYDTSRTEADRAAASVQTLLHGRYEMLETLTDLVTRNGVLQGGRTRLANAVTKIIEDYSGDTERYAALERQADSLFHNLITDFRQTFQGLKEPDYRLYLFSVMGLSNQTIAALLKENRLSSVYDRRRRVKDRIREADPATRDRFLRFL